jgi:hypothetical protein
MVRRVVHFLITAQCLCLDQSAWPLYKSDVHDGKYVPQECDTIAGVKSTSITAGGGPVLLDPPPEPT